MTPASLTLADWTTTIERSVLREMIAVISQPGILSFAGGLPAPELFPIKGYAAAMQKVLADDGQRALQYGPAYPPLKQHIINLMALRGISNVQPDQIFITTGAQQALNIVAALLVNPHAPVLIEREAYTGAQQVFQARLAQPLLIETDLESGIDVAAIAAHLQSGANPALLYTIPDAHNPLGVSISPEKRHQLIDLARRYRLPIIEDDPYGLLHYSSNPAPQPLRALDADWVFYCGSFSKILAPALRLGWLVAPPALLPKLTVIKELADLESSALTQRVVSAYFDSGDFPDHLAQLRTSYRSRRDLMLAALKAHFPAEATWTEPDAGMFIWVQLPSYINTADLLKTAIAEEKVAFIPGHAFSVQPPRATNCLRLNFTNVDPDRIDDGIARLGRVIKDALAA